MEYTITTQKGEEVKILNGVSGFANSGQLVALMGSSGAGKTSLLNILSNRLSTTTNAKIDGIVTANGIEINKLNFSSFSGYVTQEDVLMGTLTPRESIRFAAYMKVGLKGVELESKVE